MLKPRYVNILLYLLLKYIVVFVVFMFATNNFKMLQIGGIRNGGDLFYYLWMVLFFPVLEMILFSVPLFLALKIKRWIYFFAVIILIIVAEYFSYVYFTSEKHINIKGVYIELIGLVVFCLCFFRTINLIFKRAI